MEHARRRKMKQRTGALHGTQQEEIVEARGAARLDSPRRQERKEKSKVTRIIEDIKKIRIGFFIDVLTTARLKDQGIVGLSVTAITESGKAQQIIENGGIGEEKPMRRGESPTDGQRSKMNLGDILMTAMAETRIIHVGRRERTNFLDVAADTTEKILEITTIRMRTIGSVIVIVERIDVDGQ